MKQNKIRKKASKHYLLAHPLATFLLLFSSSLTSLGSSQLLAGGIIGAVTNVIGKVTSIGKKATELAVLKELLTSSNGMSEKLSILQSFNDKLLKQDQEIFSILNKGYQDLREMSRNIEGARDVVEFTRLCTEVSGNIVYVHKVIRSLPNLSLRQRTDFLNSLTMLRSSTFRELEESHHFFKKSVTRGGIAMTDYERYTEFSRLRKGMENLKAEVESLALQCYFLDKQYREKTQSLRALESFHQLF